MPRSRRRRASTRSRHRRHANLGGPRSSRVSLASESFSQTEILLSAGDREDRHTKTPGATSGSRRRSHHRQPRAFVRSPESGNGLSKMKPHATVRKGSGAGSRVRGSRRPNVQSSKTSRSNEHTISRLENTRSAKNTKTVGTERAAASRMKKEKERPSGLWSFFFGSSEKPQPEKKITCITCLADDILISRSAKLACSHRMCHSCLKRIFILSIKDPQHMPPRCCTSDHIPLKHVDKLFDMRFKVKWNQKYQEFTTKNKIYCPAKGCGEWIKPSQINSGVGFGFGSRGDGRKSAKCSRCKTKICCACKGKWHSSKICPDDEETKKFIAMAQQKGWQRCYSCAAIVELQEGCNHMTCRCTAEFCMICGLKWKTCDCPWFNYTLQEEDQLNYMNFPRLAVGMEEDPNARLRVNGIARERNPFQLPDGLFRRFQLLDIGQDDIFPAEERNAHHVLAFGNVNNHFLNDHFIPQRHERRYA
jgi:hypothetical protein